MEQGRPEDVQPAGIVERGPSAVDAHGATEAPPRPETHVVFAGATDVGRQRKHNEDCLLIRAEHGLFCVADGMGGHNAGDVASKLVTTSLGNYFDATAEGRDAHEITDEHRGLAPGARRLAAGVGKANRDVFTISSTHQQHHGMGSTVVAIHLSDGMVHVAHVGDSRCYRIRDGEMTQLTRDHSLINDALDMKPDLTKEELARLPKNIITRALGMKDVVKVDIKSEPVLPGDAFLLCSDGLTGMVPVPQILEVIGLASEPQEACELLIAEANDHGGNDNISAVLVRIEEGPEEARAPRPSQVSAPAHTELSPDSADEDELARLGDLTPEAAVELSPESGPLTSSTAAAIPARVVPPAPASRPVFVVPPPPPVPVPRIPSQPPVPAPRPSSSVAAKSPSVPPARPSAPSVPPAKASAPSVPPAKASAPSVPPAKPSAPAVPPAKPSAPVVAARPPEPAPSPILAALAPTAEAAPAVVPVRVLEIVPDPDEDFPPLPAAAPDLEVGGGIEEMISEEEAAALEAGGEIDLDLRGPWPGRARVDRCARCRHELYPGNLFCVECGARIEASPDGVAGEP